MSVTLPDALRADFEALARSQTAEVRLVRRARIALLADLGWSNTRIACEVGISDKTVRVWRSRIAATLSDKAPFREVWSHEALRDALWRETHLLLSLSEVARILRSEDIRPHRIRMWLNRQDPKFWEKAERVCQQYLSSAPGVTVLCVDEKRLFAHQRLHPLLPAGRSRAVRKEFAYRRNGTSTLLAAFDVRTGEVYGECRPTRKAPDLLEFMETLASCINAEPWQATELTKLLHERGAAHLRVRKRGAVLTIESGDEEDPWPHARLRRDTVHLWCLEMAVRGDRWERTPFRGLMEELVDALVDQFPWTLSPIEQANLSRSPAGRQATAQRCSCFAEGGTWRRPRDRMSKGAGR